MPASYPTSIKSFTTKTDGVDDVLAAHVNDIQAEVTAIETELGTLPKGASADVKTRIVAAEIRLTNLESGWIADANTWTYASASTFTVPGDVTAQFPTGTKIKLTQTTVKYFYVLSATYSSPNTTVTVTAGNVYTLANAAITSPNRSYEEAPQGFPDYFAWTPTWTNLTVGNGVLDFARFKIAGKMLHFAIGFTLGSTSSVAGSVNFALPVTISTLLGLSVIVGNCYSVDAGVASYFGNLDATTNQVTIKAHNVSGTYTTLANLSSTVPFTWGTGDYIRGSGIYEI